MSPERRGRRAIDASLRPWGVDGGASTRVGRAAIRGGAGLGCVSPVSAPARALNVEVVYKQKSKQ